MPMQLPLNVIPADARIASPRLAIQFTADELLAFSACDPKTPKKPCLVQQLLR